MQLDVVAAGQSTADRRQHRRGPARVNGGVVGAFAQQVVGGGQAMDKTPASTVRVAAPVTSVDVIGAALVFPVGALVANTSASGSSSGKTTSCACW
jgi:hypothetical protein